MPVLSKDLEEKLEAVSQSYRLGSLLFCVTAARFPAFASHSSRLRSLSSAPHLDEAAQSRWADAGFFLADEAAANAVCCFHCGCRLPVRAGDSTAEPLRLHERLGEQCELLTLLKVAHGMLSERHERVVASSAKLRRALAKLRSDLLERRSMLGLVESFGFARSSVLYCACRYFMTRGGQLASRPGDLIELLHECERLQPDWSHVIDVEAVLSGFAGIEESRAPREQQRQTSRPQTSSSAASSAVLHQEAEPADKKSNRAAFQSQISVEEDDPNSQAEAESDQCLLCRERTRDHVTLPCAHFLLCQGCLNSRTDCPQCGTRILAAVRAFIA